MYTYVSLLSHYSPPLIFLSSPKKQKHLLRKISLIVNPKRNQPPSRLRRKRSRYLFSPFIKTMSSSIVPTTTTTTSSSQTSTTTTNNSSTKGNGNSQACAACKYQRRKCAPDCILAPYFPHDRQRQFLNAHKLFGVSNITKIIKHLDHRDKDDAMRTIIYQSDIRAADPVGGCYRIIRELQRLVEYKKAELDIILHQLAICHAQAQQQQQQQQQQQTCMVQQISDVVVGDASCMDPSSLYGNPFRNYLQQQQPQNVQVAQDNGAPFLFVHNNGNSDGNNSSDGHLGSEDVNMWVMQDSMSSLHIKHGMNVDCEDIKPFVDMPCDDDQRNHAITFQHDQIGDQSDEALLKIDHSNLNEGEQISESAAQQVHHHHHHHHHQDHCDLNGEANLFISLTNNTS